MSYFEKFNKSAGIEFMNERTKGDLAFLVNRPVHIADFDFLNGDNGKYAVFIVNEFPSSFFFGNSIITEVLQTIEEDGKKEELAGIQSVIVERTSKKGRNYFAIEFAIKVTENDESVPF